MALTVDWSSRVISIPRADLTLIQSVPVEIRELNLNSFRLELKDLEDSEAGMVNPDTHSHNTEVSLGGITFARVIEILNGYTITFEDGQYAVNLLGANSNIGDVVNVNQVSVRSQNSAGLISAPEIEYSSFQGGVTVDMVGGTSGTLFPSGTPQQPVNNIADAKLIADYRGFSRIYVVGDITFSSTDVIDGFICVGQNSIKSRFTLEPGLSSVGCEFKEATIDGTLSGNAYIRECTVVDINYIEGKILNCVLVGTIRLAGNSPTNIINCHDGIAGDGKPMVDMGGSGQSLTVGAYTGELLLVNKTGEDKVSIDLLSGEVEIHPTVTAGEIFVRGVGTLIDNSDGAIIHWSALLSREEYTDTVYIDTTSSYAGIQYPYGTLRYPVNNIDNAKTIADSLGIRSISVVGVLSLDKSYSGYTFKSPALLYATIDLNGQDVTGSTFENIVIEGDGVGYFSATNSNLVTGMNNIQATLKNCVLFGSFVVAAGSTLQMDKCNTRSMSTVFNLNGSGSINIAGVAGVFTIANMSSPVSLCAVTGDFICNLDSSCVDGTVMLAGIGQLNDASNGVNVIDKVLPGATWDQLRSSHVIPETTGEAISQTRTWVNYLRNIS